VADFDFPADLIQLKRDWLAADEARTAAAQSGDRKAFATAGERLQDLTMALHRHPYMAESGRGHTARMALREVAAAG
jgi:hypothetical protein